MVKAPIKTSYFPNNHTKHMNDIKHVLPGYLCSNSDVINECLFAKIPHKFGCSLSRADTDKIFPLTCRGGGVLWGGSILLLPGFKVPLTLVLCKWNAASELLCRCHDTKQLSCFQSAVYRTNSLKANLNSLYKQVKSSQVTFIYTVLLTILIV